MRSTTTVTPAPSTTGPATGAVADPVVDPRAAGAEVAGCACGPTRRQLLRGTGAAAGALAGVGALAACSGQTPSPQEAAESVSSAEAGTVVVALADVPVGGAVAAKIGGQDVLVTQPTEGEVHAFSAICTHEGCAVTPGEGELVCPCHQSRYALTDAAVLGGPAPAPLPAIDVEVSGQDVVVT
ncbi:Rieske (2Fe-2S) protein [Krasilnikoviella flava]|uniref:Cytochrome bc1 complex Rieske iron-sulfur subunit n=1 Tax=Krasilnikoviella flava TaxID=526729 RepID=A0A1T5LVK3_9MICO|nr:Rieske (2Fe-2S) protein [Krasilnikoviella flava]SKC79618.1 Ferredoxin subunit of nitrite reductase or a ring-hydroxylating dioxygenase [Krasilnikoviella flava]